MAPSRSPARASRYGDPPLERELASFLDRVGEVEADGRCLYVVERAVLSGSMLAPERDPVGDVDIAMNVVLERQHVEALRLGDNDLYRIFCNESVLGRMPTPDAAAFGQLTVMRRPKARKRPSACIRGRPSRDAFSSRAWPTFRTERSAAEPSSTSRSHGGWHSQGVGRTWNPSWNPGPADPVESASSEVPCAADVLIGAL